MNAKESKRSKGELSLVGTKQTEKFMTMMIL